MDLGGKIALVIGGTGGIGSTISETLRDAGASVLATAIDAVEQAEATTRLAGIDVRMLNVGDAAEVQRLAAEIGAIDVLVNCAGITSRGEASFGEDEFLRVIDINLHGTMRVCRAFKPALAQRQGCIVNIASVMSIHGSGTAPGYAASKGGVAQLTKSLAIAWAPKGDGDGVRVNAVAPGFIVTPMTDAAIDPAYRARVNDRTPMGRWGEPQHIADAVLFLASSRASFITGVILPVDGGYLAT
jgi:NAD(P)-dependent dehydrogenase (short-subunit alcohol dehydrogenase family)